LETDTKVVGPDGREVVVKWRTLTWRQANEARDASFEYKDGMPTHPNPLKYIEERVARAIISVDGRPFSRAMMTEWDEGFGDRIAAVVQAVAGSPGEASFRKPDEELSQNGA
jgi:hypothetical protein